MLSIEEKLGMMDLYRKGVSISEIAGQTGRDRKTIRKAVKGNLQAAKRKARRSPKRERKLSRYESYLKARMADGVYNTRKLLRELRERGYTGGLTQLILYVQPYRPQSASASKPWLGPNCSSWMKWATFLSTSARPISCFSSSRVVTSGAASC